MCFNFSIMPYALEYFSHGHPHLGSDGSKARMAIVVNTKTGEHKSKEPIPMPKAKAQMRLLESLHAKEHDKPLDK